MSVRFAGLRPPQFGLVCLLATGLVIARVTAGEARSDPDAVAARILQMSGAAGGICAVVGGADAGLALALARQAPFVVQCLVADPGATEALRARIRDARQYGDVCAEALSPAGPLPYMDNLVNIVVVDPALDRDGARPAPAELLRVLAPLGLALVGVSDRADAAEAVMAQLRPLGVSDLAVESPAGTGAWVRFRKPWPAETDEWTHYLHGPDGNAVAADRVVGPPGHYQWLADPLWLRCHETDSSISALVTAQGRLFAIVDEAPISLPGQHSLPDKWSLVARDAFNGVLLWKVPIRRWGWREWKSSWFLPRPGDIPLNVQKRLVAVGDRVYVTLGYPAPVSELDARTGEILQSYPGTERTGEILFLDGKLFLSVPGENGVRVLAVEARSGRHLWATPKSYRGTTVDYVRWREMNGGIEPAVLDPSLNTATDGKALALIDGPEIVCLDAASGAERWRAAFPSDPADLNAGGIESRGNLWNGTMIVRDGVVLHASPGKLAAFAADTGQVLWSQPKKYIGHLWYEWKDVFVVGDLVWTWSAELTSRQIDNGGRKERSVFPPSVKGYDLHTGELKRDVPLGAIFAANHHHRCYRNKATSRYILASRRGTEFVDLEQGQHTVHNWVRSTCHVGMMPANGLQYVPPHPCACYLDEKLNGFLALAPRRAGEAAAVDDGAAAVRLERGPGYGRPVAIGEAPGAVAGAEDWPEFRHDARRTGAVATEVPDDAGLLWRVPVGRRLSAPVAVGDRLWVALVDEHQVACLDRHDGRQLWAFTAGARVDSPPTYCRGTLLFGAADGWVYCVSAETGQLRWRFRAAPAVRLIGAFSQLESAWPVHGSVLVLADTAYVVAGRTSQLDGGLFLYGLDAATGEVRCQARLDGPDYKLGDFEQNCQLPMGALPDVLMVDGDTIYMRSVAFDRELKRQSGRAPLRDGIGMLDDSYFKRTPWTLGGEYARLIVHDSQSAYYVRMFDSLRGLDPTVFFTPGKEGYLLFAKNLKGEKKTWMGRVPVRIRGMVLAGPRLLAAGPPDVVDPQDPLGAFEGRKGGLLYLVDAASGEKLKEHQLPSPPVFNGVAAARGRFYVADEQGCVSSFGRQ